MNSKWVKIKDKEFIAKEISVQYTIDYNQQYYKHTRIYQEMALFFKDWSRNKAGAEKKVEEKVPAVV